jgi:hypothetical protein
LIVKQQPKYRKPPVCLILFLLACLQYNLVFTVNFLVERDGMYYAKQYDVSDIIIKLDYIVGRLKEKELNKQDLHPKTPN